MGKYNKNKLKENPQLAKAPIQQKQPTQRQPTHPYPTNFSKVSYIKRTSQLSRSKYRISVRDPALWNERLTDSENEIKFLSYENEVIFF